MPFLVELGVMTAEGKVRAQRYDKFRQVNRFLELVEDVLPALPADGPLRVVDFGSGKSYLTFALHHLLTVVHEREVEIVGLDLKADVVDHCEALARKLGAEGLRFEVGDIAGYDGARRGRPRRQPPRLRHRDRRRARPRRSRRCAGDPRGAVLPARAAAPAREPGARSAAPPRHAARAVRRRGDRRRARPAARRRRLRRAGGRVHRARAHAEERPAARRRPPGPRHGARPTPSTGRSRRSSGSTRRSPGCSPTGCPRDEHRRTGDLRSLLARRRRAARRHRHGRVELAARRGARGVGEGRGRRQRSRSPTSGMRSPAFPGKVLLVRRPERRGGVTSSAPARRKRGPGEDAVVDSARPPTSGMRLAAFSGKVAASSGVPIVATARSRHPRPRRRGDRSGSATRQELGSARGPCRPPTSSRATTSTGRSFSSAPTAAATRAAPGSACRSSTR